MTILQMCQIRPHLAGYFSPLKDHEFGESTTLWRDLTQVWDAIDKGNRQWQIPAYNGGLFSSDPGQSPDGALFTKIQIPDRALGPALKHLLIDTTSDGVDGPVDFRSLSVREFGTIYEGLLESSLSKAEQDLTLDGDGAWVPAKKNDQVQIRSGAVYFHSASGERKASRRTRLVGLATARSGGALIAVHKRFHALSHGHVSGRCTVTRRAENAILAGTH